MSAPDFNALLQSIAVQLTSDLIPLQAEGWQLTPIHRGKHHRIYRAESAGQDALALKVYGGEVPPSQNGIRPTSSHQEKAKREFGALTALRHFGINLAPEPLALYENQVLMTWSEGQPLSRLPDLNDEELWHRFMALFGASGELHLLDYSKFITMKGQGYQNPEDVLDAIETQLEILDENDPLYEPLETLFLTAQERIQPRWNFAPQVGLCRRNYALQDILWDGHHLVTVDWDEADWGDMAAEVAFWNIHPDYESIPNTHWMWVRWEYSHLTKDNEVVTRATIYAQLGQLWWASYLTVELATTPNSARAALRDRYLAQAKKHFGQ